MSRLRVTGGRTLHGSVRVHGAKNSVLPILAASIITAGETVIHNCPRIADVEAAIKILTHLGCSAKRENDSVVVNAATLSRTDVPDSLMREMRSSVIFLGAILARCGEATLSTPGGCELGPRPVDLHIGALRDLGATVTEEGGNLICRAEKLRGARIHLRLPSVGATENAMLAASLAEGVTVITNAAREPEIWDLQSFLRALGVNAAGAGTPTIIIEGTRVKTGAEHRVIPDRIVASTYLAAVAAAGGDVTLTDVVPQHISTVISALEEMGCEISATRDSVHITSPKILRAARTVTTEPYPGFPTDVQPQLMAASLRANGTTVFVENIFENRYRHVEELRRLGADIQVEGRVAIVTGKPSLKGASVAATDLRGGAALIIAGLSAGGVTDISELSHIDRGYDSIESDLRALGAEILRT